MKLILYVGKFGFVMYLERENNKPDVEPYVKPDVKHDVAFDLMLNKLSNMNICEMNIKEINLKGNTELDIYSIIKNIPDDYRFIYYAL